ncbi:MAG: hypothetical protein FJX75_26665 [Armatimonadetes bacterium]|nr:hypothetical protein [Armatimonadota bacterium]
MSKDSRPCPSCGEPVYPTDDVCMSCDAHLTAAAPAPAPPPGPVPRAPLPKVWHHQLVEKCGRFWDVFPWLGTGLIVLGGLLYTLGAPMAVVYVLAALYVVWEPLFIVWFIIDIKYLEADWYWVPLAFVCCGYPWVLLFYWWKTR